MCFAEDGVFAVISEGCAEEASFVDAIVDAAVFL